MSNILIAGGTGLLGMRLSHLLKEKGHHVFHLSRKQNLNATYPAYQWDLEKKFIDPAAMEKAEVIINLAGAGVADARWTDARKQLIIDSRVD
ncbi:MAG: NAD-dependent epimerase/dehydratase family protein, partial [Saprospiraceae bacterium]